MPPSLLAVPRDARGTARGWYLLQPSTVRCEVQSRRMAASSNLTNPPCSCPASLAGCTCVCGCHDGGCALPSSHLCFPAAAAAPCRRNQAHHARPQQLPARTSQPEAASQARWRNHHYAQVTAPPAGSGPGAGACQGHPAAALLQSAGPPGTCCSASDQPAPAPAAVQGPGRRRSEPVRAPT